jgi:hypothetical protein
MFKFSIRATEYVFCVHSKTHQTKLVLRFEHQPEVLEILLSTSVGAQPDWALTWLAIATAMSFILQADQPYIEL